MNKLNYNIGKKVLKKRFKKTRRNKAVQNFNTASKAVIAFDIGMTNSFSTVKEFAKFLQSENIKTSIYGYTSEKEPPEKLLLWPDFEVFTKKEINWFGKPKGEIADKYFSQEPDILFVFNNCDNNLPFQFMVHLSKAKFKVGYYTEAENDLDLMINPTGNMDDLSYFVEQVKNYISMLNPSN